MPPLPTIADTYRITLLWNVFSGITPRNVFHVEANSLSIAEIGATIDEALDTANAETKMFEPMNLHQTFGSIDILPLDGSSATSTFVLSESYGGTRDDEIVPAAAAVVSFRTSQRGPRGRGRQYIGPVVENRITGGELDDAAVTAMNLGWATFAAAMESNANQCLLVVASYTHADQHLVRSISTDKVLGTVRRRNDQLR